MGHIQTQIFTIYHGRIEYMPLVHANIYETRKQKAKLAEKYI